MSSGNRIKSYLPETLNLNYKDIKAIKPGAFKDMARLEWLLTLKDNRISSIDPYTFQGLNKLQELSLAKNKIQILKSNAFVGLHSLKYIDLRGNRITRIENGAFAGLDSLVEVRLRGNPVTCDDAHAAGLSQSVYCPD